VPELPEVETTRRTLSEHLLGAKVVQVICRRGGLRWPFNIDFNQRLTGLTICAIHRRAKYLLVEFAQADTKRADADTDTQGYLLAHLGMSGVWAVCALDQPLKSHDHVDMRLEQNGKPLLLRFNDPRRFGAMLWIEGAIAHHALLDTLGVEPLDVSCDKLALHLKQKSTKRSTAIKQFIMDQTVVVGVGNIYASEALFAAGIHPARAAGRVSAMRYQLLAAHIQHILHRAIEAGGSSIRDYRSGDGQSGEFQNETKVYGREDQACVQCQIPIRLLRQGGRATYFCVNCQR
jgi:formamidopyrimidine-DNA glycosylase